jgi:cytochrome c-type biogenesis protein CcmH/NrfF
VISAEAAKVRIHFMHQFKCGIRHKQLRHFVFVRRLFIVCLVMTLGVGASSGVAEEKFNPQKQEDFDDIAGHLRCPTCTGLSVLDSDAPFSVQIKNEVKEQLAAGKSRDDIMAFFTDRYGAWILRAPPVKGFFVFAWIVPILLLLVGPLLILFLRGRKVQDVVHDVTSGDEGEGLSLTREEALADFYAQLEKAGVPRHQIKLRS